MRFSATAVTTTTPAMVYGPGIKQAIASLLLDWVVLAFRPVRLGDTFFTDTGRVYTNMSSTGLNLFANSVRFIVERRLPAQTIESIWE